VSEPEAVLVHGDHLGVGEQRQGEGITPGQVAAHDERRAYDGPQAHHGTLLVLGELAGLALAAILCQAQAADGQHVRVGPGVAFPDFGRPILGVVEVVSG